jgi:hypothetical protein
MKQLFITSVFTLVTVFCFSQTGIKCFSAVLNETRLTVYINSNAASGRFVISRDENDSTVHEFTCTIKDNYVYPVFSTDDIQLSKGTSLTKDPFRFVTIAGVNSLRITTVSIKRSVKTTSTLILTGCDE